MNTMMAIAAIMLNTVLCAAFSAQLDTFIISNAVLMAAVVITTK